MPVNLGTVEVRSVVMTLPASPASGARANGISDRQNLNLMDETAVRDALESLDCVVPDPLSGRVDPKLPLVTCDRRGTMKYALSPALLTGADVAAAKAVPDTQGQGWVVTLDLNYQGGRIWGDYTTAHNDQTSPGGHNDVAFMLDARVVAAPTIQTPITGGQTRITGCSGGFTQQEAQDLVYAITSR